MTGKYSSSKTQRVTPTITPRLWEYTLSTGDGGTPTPSALRNQLFPGLRAGQGALLRLNARINQATSTRVRIASLHNLGALSSMSTAQLAAAAQPPPSSASPATLSSLTTASLEQAKWHDLILPNTAAPRSSRRVTYTTLPQIVPDDGFNDHFIAVMTESREQAQLQLEQEAPGTAPGLAEMQAEYNIEDEMMVATTSSR